MRTLLLLLLAMPLLTACGVTERRAVVDGRDPDQIWAAMKAVAETPDYYMQSPDVTERWIVRENDVWIDEDHERIEVFRRLERELYQPLSKPHYEQRAWKFEMALETASPKEGGHPVMLFRTRNSGVPAHAWLEAEWYFDEVERFLGPMPASTAPHAADAPAATAPAADR